MSIYYEDDQVRLFHGDCLEITDWLEADVLVTDPPYGRAWRQGAMKNSDGHGRLNNSHAGISGDEDTAVRDAALALWGHRLAAVFGDLMLDNPTGTQQVLIYGKAPDAGVRGSTGRFRRDAEGVYLMGGWSAGIGGRSSILTTKARSAGPSSLSNRYGHPHAKPLDVLGDLLAECPPGVIADPFAGSGSTLVAARNLGRKAIGVELEERYCELIAKRLSQGVLNFGDAS